MRGIEEAVQAKGAVIVAIGTGDARYAHDFIKTESINFEVLLDEDGTAAELASLKKASVGSLLSPHTLVGSLRAFRQGHRQKKVGKRPMQLGATFIIKPPGKVVYEHLDNSVEDHAPTADLLSRLS